MKVLLPTFLFLALSCDNGSHLNSSVNLGKSEKPAAGPAENENVTASEPAGDPSTFAEANTSNPMPAPMPAPMPDPGEPDLLSEAQAPAIVSGAYLACMPSVTYKLGCYVRNAGGEAQKIPDAANARFTFTKESDGTKQNVSFKAVEFKQSPTFFAIEINSAEKGMLEMKSTMLINSPAAFNTANLDTSISVADIATDDEINATNAGSAWAASKMLVGNGNLQAEGDSCANGTSGVPADRSTFGFQLNTAQTTGDFFLTGLCGLQNTETTATLSGPNGNIKRVRLPPIGSGNIKVFSNLSLAGATYSVTLEFRPPAGTEADAFMIAGVRAKLSPVAWNPLP